MSTLQRDILMKQMNRLPPRIPASFTSVKLGPTSARHSRDFSPTSSDAYFETFRDVRIPATDDVFRVYLSGLSSAGSEAPLLLLLHGGGYSALTWSLFTKYIVNMCDCKVAAIDLRGHGCTCTSDDTDLSIDTLCRDVGNVYKNLEMEPSRTVLVGHSMGGALAVHCANKLMDIVPSIMGIVVIDVVEGTAMEALQSMKSILSRRPSSFATLPAAIQWCVSSGMTRNLEAARVSMPGQLKHRTTGKPAIVYTSEAAHEESTGRVPHLEAGVIREEDEYEEANGSGHEAGETQPTPSTQSDQDSGYVWRIDLAKTEPFWTGWFEGLSESFLNAPVTAKLLLLAGFDRLDRSLTIGQMQGKFQVKVLSRCGHAVHEDLPDKVAEAISQFLIRHKIADAKETHLDNQGEV